MSYESDPARRAVAITKSDATIIPGTRGVYVGGAGDIAARFVGDPDTTVTLVGVVAGTVLPIEVVQIMAATDATNLVALY